MGKKNEEERLKSIADNINVFQDEVASLSADLDIKSDDIYNETTSKIKTLDEEQEKKNKAEMEKLLENVKDPEKRQKVIGQLNAQGANVNANVFQTNKIEKEVPEQEEEQEIVEKIDVKVQVRISDDKMRAFLTMHPPQAGGRKPTGPALITYLNSKGIVYGINKTKIKEAVTACAEQNKPVSDFEIAAGKPAEEGVETAIEVKFKESNLDEFSGDINDEGAEQVGMVKKGQILLIISPSRPGVSGSNVLGEEIKAAEIVPLNVEAQRNTRLSGNQIISEVEGIAYYKKDSIIVKRYKDSAVEISIDKDNMTATVTLIPSIGDGLKLSKDLVIKSLLERNIKKGIDEKVIEDLVEKCESEKTTMNSVPIAKGVLPVNGKNAELNFHVRTKATQKVKKSEGSKVDYREMDTILNIKKDTLVATKIDAEKKVSDGTDILGNVLPGEDGIDIEVKPGKNIEVKVVKEGVTEYYSKIDGEIKHEPPLIDIQPLFVVKGNLDMNVGNINFLGNVLIEGNVEDDFTIKAGGDVRINGFIGASNIDAGGDVTIQGGVVSRSEGSIRAKGDVYAKFAENANIITGKSVIIDRAILNSQIAAGDSITCTKEKGQIIGGHCIAKKKIEVNELGSTAGAKTEITVGIDFEVMTKQNELHMEQERLLKALERIDMVLNKIEVMKSSKGVLSDDIKKVSVELLQKKVLINKRMHSIKMSIVENAMTDEEIGNGEILVYEDLRTDVRINMANKVIEINESKSCQRIFFDKELNRIETEVMVYTPK